ncbi:MAG: hypothetical protein IJL74_03685 [Bacilli bacterium]|nr:hypothetical protein [Bacilli bacterium]
MENEETMNGVAKGVGFALFTPKIISSIIACLIGFFLVSCNSISLIRSITYVETTATIVDITYNSDTNIYTPIYEFDYNGQKVRAKGLPFTYADESVIGQKQVISYNPKDYNKFDIGSTKDSIILFCFGSFLFVGSGIFLYKFFKEVKNM